VLIKINNMKREELVDVMENIIIEIDEIDDKSEKQKLCEDLIGMCDQIKTRLQIRMIRDNDI